MVGRAGRRSVRSRLAVLACLPILGACGLAQTAVTPVTPPATPGDGSPLPAASALGVSGTHLLRSGQPFTPRGVSLVGFMGPEQTLRGRYLEARDAFGPDELAAARGFGADTVRFVVGQAAVTPPYGEQGTTFRRKLVDAVTTARTLGFTVVIALDGSRLAGETSDLPLPDSATVAAWQGLAPLFQSDHGVAFELFNAPAPPPTAEAWAVWAGGGSLPDGSGTSVGMQAVLGAIRAVGSTNVVIVDGLDRGRTLAGAPLLDDPQGATAYGVEPYPRGGDGPATWAAAFGDISHSRPVLATEWDAPSLPPPLSDVPQACDSSTPATAAGLLGYLRLEDIGVIGYALDLPGTLVRDLAWSETSYDQMVCGEPGAGPGTLLSGYFQGS